MEYCQVSSDSDVVMVFLVDDKPSVTDGLTWLLESVKIPSAAFNSVSEFMQAIHTYGGIACAVVDLRMPEMSGLELQKQLISEGIDCPLVF
jgi:FixJ family two-component response regulator